MTATAPGREGYEGYWDEFFAAKDVFYGHMLNFKGLERPVVVLAINGFGAAERAPQLRTWGCPGRDKCW